MWRWGTIGTHPIPLPVVHGTRPVCCTRRVHSTCRVGPHSTHQQPPCRWSTRPPRRIIPPMDLSSPRPPNTDLGCPRLTKQTRRMHSGFLPKGASRIYRTTMSIVRATSIHSFLLYPALLPPITWTTTAVDLRRTLGGVTRMALNSTSSPLAAPARTTMTLEGHARSRIVGVARGGARRPHPHTAHRMHLGRIAGVPHRANNGRGRPSGVPPQQARRQKVSTIWVCGGMGLRMKPCRVRLRVQEVVRCLAMVTPRVAHTGRAKVLVPGVPVARGILGCVDSLRSTTTTRGPCRRTATQPTNSPLGKAISSSYVAYSFRFLSPPLKIMIYRYSAFVQHYKGSFSSGSSLGRIGTRISFHFYKFNLIILTLIQIWSSQRKFKPICDNQISHISRICFCSYFAFNFSPSGYTFYDYLLQICYSLSFRLRTSILSGSINYSHRTTSLATTATQEVLLQLQPLLISPEILNYIKYLFPLRKLPLGFLLKSQISQIKFGFVSKTHSFHFCLFCLIIREKLKLMKKIMNFCISSFGF